MLLGMLDEQIDSVITDSIVSESDSVVFPISLLRESSFERGEDEY